MRDAGQIVRDDNQEENRKIQTPYGVLTIKQAVRLENKKRSGTLFVYGVSFFLIIVALLWIIPVFGEGWISEAISMGGIAKELKTTGSLFEVRTEMTCLTVAKDNFFFLPDSWNNKLEVGEALCWGMKKANILGTHSLRMKRDVLCTIDAVSRMVSAVVPVLPNLSPFCEYQARLFWNTWVIFLSGLVAFTLEVSGIACILHYWFIFQSPVIRKAALVCIVSAPVLPFLSIVLFTLTLGHLSPHGFEETIRASLDHVSFMNWLGQFTRGTPEKLDWCWWVWYFNIFLSFALPVWWSLYFVRHPMEEPIKIMEEEKLILEEKMLMDTYDVTQMDQLVATWKQPCSDGSYGLAPSQPFSEPPPGVAPGSGYPPSWQQCYQGGYP